MGEREATDSQPVPLRRTPSRFRLSLVQHVLVVGVTLVTLLLGWAWLNHQARNALDRLLDAHEQLEIHEDGLARLDMALSHTQREAYALMSARSPEARARFEHASEAARAQARSLREAVGPGPVDDELALLLEGLERYLSDIDALQRMLGPGQGTLGLEQAVAQANASFEQFEPRLAAIDVQFERADLDSTEAIKAQRDGDALATGALFSAALILAVVFLFIQLRGASTYARRVRDLARAMEHVADGDLSRRAELERASAHASDEINALSREFERMLGKLEELAHAALAIARGDLSVEISSSGELQDAFRAMVAELRRNVAETREGAATIAAAAAEIGEAAAGQEQAATYQAEGIREVSVAMRRLAEAATEISTAATEVLANADQTRTRAEGLVSNFSELEQHLEEVSTQLQRIRDISDRSDLLALNGSLEATRAGEAGRGFALVASEMRRLAERVKGTIGGIRAAVANIDAATAKTAEATTDSRTLAKRTSAVAAQIVELTETQSAETEQVSAGVQDIALVLESSAAVSSETRFAASELEHRAKILTKLVARFELEGSAELEEEG